MTARDMVFDWIDYHARYNPSWLAAVDLESGRRFDYAAFNDRATRLATGLRDAHGVGKGDTVGISALNSTDFFELMFACWKLGAIFVPLNWRLAPAEVAEIVAHGELKLVFADAQFAGNFPAALKVLTRRDNSADCEYETLITAHAPQVMMEGIEIDDVHTLLYTSGTTGRPKGVPYTHRMTANYVLHAGLHVDINRTARTLTYAPLFHSAGLWGGAAPLFHFGGALYIMRGWNAEACLSYLTNPDYAITHCVGVPTHYVMMQELPAFETASFPTLRYLGIGSAPVSEEILNKWEAKGLALCQSFGMTEVFSVSLTPPDKARALMGSAGHRLMHVDLQIGDDQGVELPRGTVGEIQIKGPGVMPGYWKDPELTAQSFTPNGWFKSGDGARMDENGVITIVDRIKDMFISGGENIYPAEIEHVINEFDQVSLVSVVAIKDERWGEVGIALVQLRKGETLDAETVLERCRERLARYKVPKYVRFVDQLPISPQGKILKKDLRAQYANFDANKD